MTDAVDGTSSGLSSKAARFDALIARLPGRYRHLVWTTLAGTSLLMVLGAYTSAIGAGLACPDWPTCYGTWIPFLRPEIVAASPFSAQQIAAEWIHRTVAVLVGFGIAGSAAGAWRYARDVPVVKWALSWALVLLPLQVLLGGLTVTRALEPIVVTAHLGIALLILASLTAGSVALWLAGGEMGNAGSTS